MKRENGKRLIRSRLRQLAEFAPQASRAAVSAGRLSRRVILHPADYSEASRQAFELACRLARDSESRLVVIHVAEPVRVSSLGMVTPPLLPKGYRGAWESRLRLVQARDRTVHVEHRLEEGDVADAILRVAREAQADLIVMAGRERAWLGRLLTGERHREDGAPGPLPRSQAERAGAGKGSRDSRGRCKRERRSQTQGHPPSDGFLPAGSLRFRGGPLAGPGIGQ